MNRILRLDEVHTPGVTRKVAHPEIQVVSDQLEVLDPTAFPQENHVKVYIAVNPVEIPRGGYRDKLWAARVQLLLIAELPEPLKIRRYYERRP